jgi:alcohol dehydrogenase class IV
MTALGAFRHAIPALRVYYGDDCLAQLPAELRRANRGRAVIICGQSIARDPGGLELVRAALGPLCVGVFDGVKAHSPLPAVMAAVDALRRYEADAVVAVGGGSAIVSARAASILLAEGKTIHDLCTRFEPGRPPISPKLLRPKLPQFVVPTTPTTAYAKAGAAVVDPAVHKRLALFDPKTRAQALFFCPGLALTAPPALVRDASLNAFVMAIQGLESTTREPLADALLLHAVRLVRDYLPRLEAEPGSADIRGQLMLAALLSGQGTDYTSGGLASVIGHCVGARFAAEQGVINAILLPHTIRFNAPATAERLVPAAELLASVKHDQIGAAEASQAVESFFAALGLPSRLRDVGVTMDALPRIAADAGTDWFLFQNPRPVSDPTELMGVLTAAW